jgi:hypothetical protein
MVEKFLQGFAKLLRRVEEWRKGPVARDFFGVSMPQPSPPL